MTEPSYQPPHLAENAASASGNAAAFAPSADDVFARIAGRYDFLCDLFSLFAHRVWKARMAQVIAEAPGAVVLDVASGTGGIPFRVLDRLGKRADAPRIIATDICPQMLDLARRKIGERPGVDFALADAHSLEAFPTASVDVFSISFAMKICDRHRVLDEAARVLRPGGLFLCLEAARIPNEALHWAYLKYVDWCMPMIARLATGNDPGAYQYLTRGIHGFPSQHEFAREIEARGFRDVGYENMTAGVVALHRGVKT